MSHSESVHSIKVWRAGSLRKFKAKTETRSRRAIKNTGKIFYHEIIVLKKKPVLKL